MMRHLAHRCSALSGAVAQRWAHTGGVCAPPAEASQIGAGIGRLSSMVLDRGEGSFVWNTEGERYLDFACGIGVTNLGHCHPKVKAAVHAQVDKIWHAQVSVAYHQPMLDLTTRLRKVMPPDSGLDTFLFVTSGSEAVEAAVKLARHATRKQNVIVFQGGYHGRTLLTMSMTTSKTIYRGGFGPHAAGIHVAPMPFFHQRRTAKMEDPVAWAIEQLELMMMQQTTPEETACVVIEPVLGEGGYLPPPMGMLHGIRDFCDKHGLLMVADEVQSGFARTGKMFAVEYEGVRPDILVFAKGVGSGFPLAGVAASKELMDRQPPGCQGGTYAGNAVSCAAANATIDVMMQDGFLANVQERGKQLREGLYAIKEQGAPIEDVRGPGLMLGLEFDDRKVEKGFAAKVAKACLGQGLMVLSTGIFETLRLVPPLTVSADECAMGLDLLGKAVKEVQGA